MGTIKADFEDLMLAMGDNSDLTNWYLDKETGEIFPLSEESDAFDGEEELAEKIDQNPERYQIVETIDSSESFQIMERFIYSLPESEAKKALGEAILKRRPFRNFKDTLYDYEDIQKQWYEYHAEAMYRAAQEWIESLGLNIEIIRRHGAY